MFWNGFFHSRKPVEGSGLFCNKEITGLFEEILNRGTALRVRVTGNSMKPFLCSGETVILKKVPASLLQVGDIVFFKDKNNFPILHRLLKKREFENKNAIFYTKGDAMILLDEPFSSDNYLGKVCVIEKRRNCINLESYLWATINRIIAFMLSKMTVSKKVVTPVEN